MNYDINCGCKQCTAETGRSPGCHGSCERYKRFRERLDAVNNSKRIEMEKDSFFYKKSRRHK